MLNHVDLCDGGDVAAALPRAAQTTDTALRARVAEIVDDVRKRGDTALAAYTEELDGWRPTGDIDAGGSGQALASLAPDLREALEAASTQIRWFHEQAAPQSWRANGEGATVGVDYHPLRRVGVYVPGGRAAYPSTVLMTAIPARVAGVEEVIVATPPDDEGRVEQTTLAAARLCGVDRVVRAGGAQAVAAMAYGTEQVPACDKVVGPGNAWVAAAKQQVAADGACGIDAQAGVTEIAIVADDHADAEIVAADLVAQAEHDPLATCVLITPSEALIDRVETALEREVAATRHRERVTEALTGRGGACLVADLRQATDVASEFAAEHTEVQTADGAAVARRIRRAGAVFVGRATPVSIGDYCAGPNHTLPTGGTARFTGGLSTTDFMVPVNWVEYSRSGLAQLQPTVAALSAAEDLPAHGRAVDIRLERL